MACILWVSGGQVGIDSRGTWSCPFGAPWQNVRRGPLCGPMPPRSPYQRPPKIQAASLKELLAESGRPGLAERQFDLLRRPGREGGKDDVRIFLSGDRALLTRKCVSIVGTREVSPEGWQRAAQLARRLASYGVVVVSG